MKATSVKRDWGPKGWEPLLYLCFTRLPLPGVSANAVAIARALLDARADSRNVVLHGGSQQLYRRWSVRSAKAKRAGPHILSETALVRLLLERGANPYDQQVVYNIHFEGKVLWFLELISREHAVRTGHAADWADPEWQTLNAGGYGTGARWFLEVAVDTMTNTGGVVLLFTARIPTRRRGRVGGIASGRSMTKRCSAGTWASRSCSFVMAQRVLR